MSDRRRQLRSQLRAGLRAPEGQAPLFSGALDGLPVATAAFGLRRLVSSYVANKAINVRRASDNATADFGFVGEHLDIAGLAAFLAATTGFITRWYDQSGGANDQIQATPANQPSLDLAVAALGNRPGIKYGDAGALFLQAASTPRIDNAFAIGGYLSTVIDIQAASANDRMMQKADWIISVATGTTRLTFTQTATTNGSWQLSANIGIGGHVYDVAYSSALLSNVPTQTVDGVVAGQSSVLPTGTITPDTGQPWRLGNQAAASGWPDHINEVVLWALLPSAPQQVALRGNQKAYWGTP